MKYVEMNIDRPSISNPNPIDKSPSKYIEINITKEAISK